MRTRLTALVVALAVLVLGAAPASAAQLAGRDFVEAFGASSNVTVKDKYGAVTSYTWKDKGSGGHWVKDKKYDKKHDKKKDKHKGWDKGYKDKDRSECVCKDDHKHDKGWDKGKKDKKGKGHKGKKDKGHKGWDGWHPGGHDECRDEDETPGTPDEGETPDEETPDVPDEETPDTETPDTPDTETPDTETPDTDTPDEDVIEDSGELDSTVTAPVTPTVPTVAGGPAPAATPVVAEPTFAG